MTPVTVIQVTAAQLVTDALTELRVARAGDVIAPESLMAGLGKLNRLIDRYNAHPRAKFTIGFASYVPTLNVNLQTIGPEAGATWTLAVPRPHAIKGANVIINTSTPNVRVPLAMRDATWWRQQRVQALATAFPTDCYYEPTFPNGSVYLWPAPTTAYPIELETDTPFAQLTATDTIYLPPGYRDAMTLRLAADSARSFGQTPSRDLVADAARGEGIIFGLNDRVPNARTRDGGMPGAREAGKGRFNFYTGFVE